MRTSATAVAKERSTGVFSLAASSSPIKNGFVYANRFLAENRVWGSDLENRTFVGPSAWLSSTMRPGCAYRCDGIASVSTVQRYYASSYGRFTKPDPGYAGTLKNPGSLNRYSYTLGDPVNASDPRGLCTVVGSGITQSAYSSSTSSEQEFANAVGGISVAPYSNGSLPGGVVSVIVQGMGVPTGATLDWLNALALAAQTAGPISIYAFSGSAGAFTNAYNWLTPAIQSRISSITYIDPGNFLQPLTSGVSGTTINYYSDNSDAANLAVQIFGSVPLGPINYVDTGSCGHDENCVYNRFFAQLASTATSCSVGAGGVFGMPQQSYGYGGFSFSNIWSWMFGSDPVPSVTETISYDVDQ